MDTGSILLTTQTSLKTFWKRWRIFMTAKKDRKYLSHYVIYISENMFSFKFFFTWEFSFKRFYFLWAFSWINIRIYKSSFNVKIYKIVWIYIPLSGETIVFNFLKLFFITDKIFSLTGTNNFFFYYMKHIFNLKFSKLLLTYLYSIFCTEINLQHS